MARIEDVIGFRAPEIQLTPGVLPFAYDSPAPQHIRLTLDTARSDVILPMSGNVIWVDDASDIDANANIKLNSQQSNGVSFTNGKAIIGVAFKELYITNTAQAGKYIDLFTIVVPGLSQIQVVNPGSTFDNVSFTKATTGANPAWVTVVQAAASAVVLAADATRRSATISSPTTNTQVVNVGIGAASGAAAGIPLDPGESISVDGTMAIYAYTGAGVNQTLSISTSND